MGSPSPSPLPRARAGHRPELDQACAGCPLLGLLRALRRAGVEASGRLSCEPAAGRPADGAATIDDPLLADVSVGQARLRVLAGPDEPEPGSLAGRGRLERVRPDQHAEVEAAIRRGLAGPGETLLLAVVPCPRGEPRRPALAIAPARCNRCGACLSLGCPAIADPGGDAMVIDPAICTGCGRCAPLCRGRAIGPPVP